MLIFDGTTVGIVHFLIRLNNNIVQGFPVSAVNIVRTTDVALSINARPYPFLPTVDDLGCAGLLCPGRIGRQKRWELVRVDKETRPSHELHDRGWLYRHSVQGHEVLWGKRDLSRGENIIENLKRVGEHERGVMHPKWA